MTSRAFISATLLVTVSLAALVAALNWRINFYGLYGEVRGQERAVTSNERWTKYLYAFNQIPSNYDALLVGSSLSANLDTAKVDGFRMYNLSMTGANVAEEQVLLEAALDHGSYRLVVFCLYPYLLKDHEFKAGQMEPRDYWAGLGSLPLLEDYLVAAGIHFHAFRPRFTPAGAQDMDNAGGQSMNADQALRNDLSRLKGPAQALIDPVALRQLATLVRSARSSGAQLLVYLPPVYKPRYDAMRSAYREFQSHVLPLFDAREPVLDFNDGSFEDFATDPNNFFDGTHYNHIGAAIVDRAFAARLAAALKRDH